ncbi:hydroxymethylglutaryl-CoA lyase [Denitrificimonas caeni]|uniref:hydroxymethylglutaryl-CoA lyase n=1 Tax=Denitrificimonas caeni TaxID=521720 RepID=UPI0019650927|nr:hydroxymethylglutaryl-CoA lyase [Denitrificimonas caeni]
MSDRVYIQEVALRDGLQNEALFIPTADKVALVNALSLSGVSKIEVTSFTSPKAIPSLRDAEQLMQSLQRNPHVCYSALVPNVRGAERALTCAVDEMNLVLSASDSHGLANLRMTAAQSLIQFAEIVQLSQGHSVRLNASISTAFGCPFSGAVADVQLMRLIEQLLDLGLDGITLCDTTGMADPAQVAQLCQQVLQRWPEVPFTLHFHDTRGMGLANALSAWQVGVRYFDASLGGLGGCPYAPGASGNICTEDLVHMLQRMGIDTGVNLAALLDAASTLPELLQHPVPSALLKAGVADRRYPLPKAAQAKS